MPCQMSMYNRNVKCVTAYVCSVSVYLFMYASVILRAFIFLTHIIPYLKKYSVTLQFLIECP